jgi:hypothetical protein
VVVHSMDRLARNLDDSPSGTTSTGGRLASIKDALGFVQELKRLKLVRWRLALRAAGPTPNACPPSGNPITLPLGSWRKPRKLVPVLVL